MKLYFSDAEIRKGIREKAGYTSTIEKAHGQMEKREYYQTEDIRWLAQGKEWKGIKSIGIEEKTIQDGKGERKEYRYYISSLTTDIARISSGNGA